MTTLSRILLPALALLAPAACSGPSTTGQERMDALGHQLERVAEGLQSSKLDFQEALEAHGLLVANADDDLPRNFKRFANSIEDCVENQQELAKAAAQIQTNSSSYLAGWEADNERIADGDLKSRGEERRATAATRLESVQELLASVQASQEPLIALLRDHATFLSNDLNVEAASSLSASSGKLRESATKLYAALDSAAADLRATARTLAIRTQN